LPARSGRYSLLRRVRWPRMCRGQPLRPLLRTWGVLRVASTPTGLAWDPGRHSTTRNLLAGRLHDRDDLTRIGAEVIQSRERADRVRVCGSRGVGERTGIKDARSARGSDHLTGEGGTRADAPNRNRARRSRDGRSHAKHELPLSETTPSLASGGIYPVGEALGQYRSCAI
jgi:hypothetical protein